MKKVIAVILALTMVFALCACGKAGTTAASGTDSSGTTGTASTELNIFMDSRDRDGLSFTETVQWIFDSVRRAAGEYPNFFTAHSLSFASDGRDRAKNTMEGPYPFLMVYKQPVWASVLWLIAIPGGAYLIALLLYKLSLKVSARRTAAEKA